MLDFSNNIAAIFAALSCFLLIIALGGLAKLVGLVDVPDKRKLHEGEVPIVGGLSIYFAVLFSLVISQPSTEEVLPFYIGFALILLGSIDDKFNLSARLRLPIQLAIAYSVIYFSDLMILNVGNIVGAGDVMLTGAASVIFTLICVVGVINSINMIDGVDGLAGSILVVTIAPLCFLSAMQGSVEIVTLSLSLVSAMLVFLYFNSRLFRSRAKIFMGDAGSMFLGLVLVWFFIDLSQGEGAVLSPVSAGWLFGLPLADTVSVMVRRVFDGCSPFAADRKHLHYKLIDAGCSVNQTVRIMLTIHVGFVLVGIIGNYYRVLDPILFSSFVLAVLLHYFFAETLIYKMRKNPKE